MNIREMKEEREYRLLRDCAVHARASVGREREEAPCTVRTVFERDRDRIIHSKAFRRLRDKTQVFISPEGDHYRTRLTHTLEVSQIARTLAAALGLNENLTEAIALGHDLGHTPFGHTGEAALNEVCPFPFKHNEQSLRIVKTLEADGRGLNLCGEVLDGILNHGTADTPSTLEGAAVRFADKIAYINHDIDDAIRAGILKESQLPPECIAVLGESGSARINTMIIDIVNESSAVPELRKSPAVEQATKRLRAFLFETVYIGSEAKADEQKARELIIALYEYFTKNPASMPIFFRELAEREGISRAVCDYVAGMTDSFAVKTYRELFIPKSWG